MHSVALQEDGKIIIAGESSAMGHDVFLTVARINTDGTLDISFGNEGAVVTKLINYRLVAYAVLVQTDGKIVAVGSNDFGINSGNPIVVRYLTDGTLDSTFGTNGLQLTTLASTVPHAAALQPDGKIIAVGFNSTTFVLERYNGGDLILPITYTKFTAAQSQQYITLNWQTATELNNRYFAVERSSNGANYTSIAQVNSAGISATVKDYFYTDKLPLQGTIYYRLKQTDADGKFSYSKTVSISYLKPGSIQVYPNPAKDKLTVKGLNAAISNTIFILDVQGKTLLQFTAKASTYSFSVSSLAPGTYMVRVKNDNGIATEKFVKQ